MTTALVAPPDARRTVARPADPPRPGRVAREVAEGARVTAPRPAGFRAPTEQDVGGHPTGRRHDDMALFAVFCGR